MIPNPYFYHMYSCIPPHPYACPLPWPTLLPPPHPNPELKPKLSPAITVIKEEAEEVGIMMSGALARDEKVAEKQEGKRSVSELTGTCPKRKVVKKLCKGRSKVQSKQMDQKQGRNSNSNLFRMFFRRLNFKAAHSSQSIQTIIQKHGLNISLEQFLGWYQHHNIDFRNYIKVSSIRPMFLGHALCNEHAKIMRVLLKEFIRNEALPCYLTSKKIRRGVMEHNLTSLRLAMHQLLTEDLPE